MHPTTGRNLAAHRRAVWEKACRWPEAVQQRALTLTRMLAPCRVVAVDKIRVGSGKDGGYVMLDDFDGIETAFSLGIGGNVDWDYAIAERGITVHQFDHTVDGPPRSHDRFRFHKRRITAHKTPESETLASVLTCAGPSKPASSILKIDIENEEWSVFAAADREVLDRFSQILCEFHAFEYLHLDYHYNHAVEGLRKLKQSFDVVHVHGNNAADITYIKGAPVPFVLEVALANRRRFRIKPSGEVFPTSLDYPNDDTRPDYYLGRFKFG